MSAPYLSIVVTARNDNYGGDFNERLQNSIHWLSAVVEENKLSTELIIVDYNPVAENPPLAQMFKWPEGRKYLTIRLLHVPNEIHQRLVNPAVRKTVPLFEFVVKNMAIRRAKGEYILGTNADILFHPDIIKFIAQRTLDKQHYYRAERYDYKKIDSYDYTKIPATLRKIQRNVFRLYLNGYDHYVKWGENFFENSYYRIKNSVLVFCNFNVPKIEFIAHLLKWKINYENFLLHYHMHAAGDFMLMHRDHWFSLRSYAEDTLISTHCDALFTVMAKTSGLEQTVLPWPVYHQDHERRYNTDISEFKKDNDMYLMFRRLVSDTQEMRASGNPKIVNDADWGQAGEEFKETVV